MFTLIFAILILGGIAMTLLGGVKAWNATTPEESSQNFKVLGFGATLLILGIIGFGVRSMLSPDSPEIPVEVNQQIDNPDYNNENNIDTNVSEQENQTADPYAQVDFQVVSDELSAPHILNSEDRGLIAKIKSATPLDPNERQVEPEKPKYGAIDFLGISYNKNGQHLARLFVGDTFQINIKVQNAMGYIWDKDTLIDADNDGVSDNDRDSTEEDPLFVYYEPGNHEINLTAYNADTISNKLFDISIEEANPEVNFTAKADSSIPSLIRLDAGSSILHASGEAFYAWEIDGQDVFLDNVSDDGSQGEYILDSKGRHEIILTVTQNGFDGRSSFRSIKKKAITIESLLSAEILSEEDVKIAPASFTFDSEAGEYTSFGIDNQDITAYQWDFGDGIKKTGKEQTHRYASPGEYTVKLRVRTRQGEEKTVTKKIFLSNRGAPISIIKAPDLSGHPGKIFVLDAGESMSPVSERSMLSYSWDFGDSSTPSIGEKVSHRFDKAGRYTVTLTVTDDSPTPTRGLYNSSEVQIQIEPVAPTARFDTQASGRTIQFDASLSQDPDNNIDSYIWDFGDGTNQVEKSAYANHRYDQPGSYIVNLTVKDRDRLSDSYSSTITIK